jgi:hypothetical protein
VDPKLIASAGLDADSVIGLVVVSVRAVYEVENLFTIEIHDVFGQVSTSHFKVKWALPK